MVDQLQIQRDLTHAFILSDPTTLTLIPKKRVRTASGGFKMASISPREPQVVKLIGSSEDGIVSGEGGFDRQFEYTIVGEYDANMEIDDEWEDRNDTLWRIYAIEPYNKYEVKARARAYGEAPFNG